MRVLIVRIGALGDVLHALPAVTALHRARPGWQIDWVVDPRWAPLLVPGEGHGPVVHHAHLAETKVWSSAPLSLGTLRSVGCLRRELREPRYDVVVDMQGTLRSAVVGTFAKAEQFAGYGDPREAMAARLYKKRLKRHGTHVVEQGAALLGEACGVELAPAWVDLPVEPWAEKWAEEDAVLSRPLCVLGAGGGWGAKQWPSERFGELARELRAKGFGVVVNAPQKDDAVAAAVVAASDGAARMVVCNVSGLIALLRRADLFVGGDSGPTHLAAALGVPVVGLYGPTDPARNGPWGPGVCRVLRDAGSVTSHKRVDAVDAGLARITVDEVMDAVSGLVARG
jgi:heptosyltransferase-1